MKRLLPTVLVLAIGCSRSAPPPRSAPPTPAIALAADLPRALDLAVSTDERLAVRMSDGRVLTGPIAGPLDALDALRSAVDVARMEHVTCGRFEDDTVRCAHDDGRVLAPPRTTGVRWLGSGSELRVATTEGAELWALAPTLIVRDLPAVDGARPELPAFDSFELARDWGVGAARGLAFCWGMDPPVLRGERPDREGDWGQDIFVRPRTLAPSMDTRRVEVYRSGVCLFGAGDVLATCVGTIDVGSGALTRCTAAPCRCGANPARTHVVCEGRSAETPDDVTTWIDGVTVLAGARCFVTARGGAGCFGAEGIERIADLPPP